jgi:hypothetical protein
LNANNIVWIGDTFLSIPPLYQSFYWSSGWGNSTLYEYAMYTDPEADLDGDGLANRLELLNFTNPFVPSGNGVQVATTGGTAGTTLRVSYTISTDGGLAYAAPFATAATPSPVAVGITLPFSLQDPLVMATLGPQQAWFGNVTGTLNSFGATEVTLQIPVIPGLAGIQIYAAIATFDPTRPSPIKTRSPAYPITVF